MHLSRILDQIKRHPSPTEALTKLGKAMDKHEDNLLEKGFRILKSELCANVYEAINGPHFDEEHAKYAVEGMENEDGSKGPHWTVEETTSIANQMGINLKSEKHNKWDWYVAMNMIYSDFYKAVVAITGGASTKHFAELTKAWICDKDISEGKMWHYYVYIMCDDEDNDYKAYEHMSHDREYDSDYKYGRERRSSGRMSYPYSRYEIEDEYEYSDRYAIGKVGGEVGFSAERVINAVNAGDCNVIKAISDCCCTTQRSIDSVNLNLTQMNADNRLSICQQTNTLQNAITSGFNNLSSENATRFNILGSKIDAQTQIINDKFCQLEMREMQNKIDALRDEKNALQTSAITQQQTQNIVNQIKPCPVPAYLTCNPYGCNGGFTGYGYGYGYGDSCCA